MSYIFVLILEIYSKAVSCQLHDFLGYYELSCKYVYISMHILWKGPSLLHDPTTAQNFYAIFPWHAVCYYFKIWNFYYWFKEWNDKNSSFPGIDRKHCAVTGRRRAVSAVFPGGMQNRQQWRATDDRAICQTHVTWPIIIALLLWAVIYVTD